MRLALFIALLVACGDDSRRGTNDGGIGDGDIPADADIDADPNVRGTVTVTIVDKNGAALPGMYVVFIDRDGTVTETMTDAAGMAQADVYPSASVTAIRARGMSYALATVTELVPGDEVTLISAAPDARASEDPFSSRRVPMHGADIAASPNGASKSGPLATFSTIAPHGLAVGDRVVVSNVGQSGYDGNWTVASTPTATTFTANIGGGPLNNSGSVPAGGATVMKAVPFTITYPAFGGADHYEVRTRCGSVDVGLATSPALALPVGCATAMMSFEVVARSTAGAALAHTQQMNVAVTPGGSVAFTDTWHATTQLTATYTNPTALVTRIGAARFSPSARGVAVAEGANTASATTTLMLTVSKPASAAITTQLLCDLDPSCAPTASGGGYQTITEIVDGTSASYVLDIEANALPWVKALYVPETTTLEITVAGAAAYDIFEANLRYAREQAIYTWRVFGPIAHSIKFPTLPATAPGNPTVLPTDDMAVYQAFIGESDAINGYRDAIENVFEALGTCEASPNPSLKPFPGTKNRLSQWN